MCRAIVQALANLLTPWPRTISELVYVVACGVGRGSSAFLEFSPTIFFFFNVGE